MYIFCLFLSFSAVQNSPGLFAAFGFKYISDADGHNAMPVLIGLTLFSQTFWGPVEKVLSLAMNFNSRRNEFQADKFACDLGMGADLAEGLIKISIGNLNLWCRFSAYFNLFISRCAATENLGNMVPDSLYSAYHFSHPPLVERLRAIKAATEKAKSDKKKN